MEADPQRAPTIVDAGFRRWQPILNVVAAPVGPLAHVGAMRGTALAADNGAHGRLRKA